MVSQGFRNKEVPEDWSTSAKNHQRSNKKTRPAKVEMIGSSLVFFINYAKKRDSAKAFAPIAVWKLLAKAAFLAAVSSSPVLW